MASLRKLETTDAVIDALGGRHKVAEITRRDPHVISNWRQSQRGRFPKDTITLFQPALRKARIEAPLSLWGLPDPSELQAAE